MKVILSLLALVSLPFSIIAQQKDTIIQQKENFMEVTVQSFNYKKQWEDVPASVALLSAKKLEEIGGSSSMLPAFNSITGVRMEERSPSSFRLSMRGSLLRSPFGVRNIKVYWNSLPLTDGGSNTYLDLVDITQLSSIEVAKGPTASMYGAGTSGMVLLESKNIFSSKPTNVYHGHLDGGSFGLVQEDASWRYESKNYTSQLIESHQQSDGYRQQSASHKDNVTWNTSFLLPHQQFEIISFYTRLYYQTPGGLTLAQMNQNPKLARQAGGGYPSDIQQQAAIYNNTFFVGVHHVYTINKSFSTDVAVVFDHTLFKNPYITDYETRWETNANANAKLIYKHQLHKVKLQWITGGELLANHAIIEDDGNLKGKPDTVQYKDNVYSGQWFVFTQAQATVDNWDFQAGVSANNQTFRYKRLTDSSTNYQYIHKNTNIVAMPRFSVGYQLSRGITAYGVVSKGFSPPSLAEIRPSSRSFNTTLQAEYGWNEELGIKGGALRHRFEFDINYYRFRLQDAIVSRNNPNGSQYYVNAGNTKQDGFEAWLQCHLYKNPSKLLKAITLSESVSYQPYKFISYQLGTTNYSGNRLTGVPQHISVTGLSVEFRQGYFVHVTYTYTSAIPLDDANNAYAKAFHLLQSKIGWEGKWNKATIQLYIGGDNLLNELYSLGNDINAAGSRFYNPAPTINFYGGCKIGF